MEASPPGDAAPILLLSFEDGARSALATRLGRAGLAFEAVEPTWSRVQAATAAREAAVGGKAVPKVMVVDLSVRPSHARACVGQLLRRASWKGCSVVFARAPTEAAERAKALAEAPGAVFASGDEEMVRLAKRALA